LSISVHRTRWVGLRRTVVRGLGSGRTHDLSGMGSRRSSALPGTLRVPAVSAAETP
jgi:hypothetical protein